MTRRRWSPSLVWWTAAGVAELVIAVLLLANGYWWTIFGTLPATAACAYFVYRERARRPERE